MVSLPCVLKQQQATYVIVLWVHGYGGYKHASELKPQGEYVWKVMDLEKFSFSLFHGREKSYVSESPELTICLMLTVMLILLQPLFVQE